jgi:uncharacterized protein (TIGR02145 family)
MKKIFTLFLLTLIGECLFSQTIVPGGDVSGSWTQAGSPYLINGDITISYNDVLTIGPGVQIVFQDNYSFLILGDLFASGTLSDSVYFTADGITGYINSTNKSGGWGGLSTEFPATEYNNITLNYCVIEYSTSYCIKANARSDLNLNNIHVRNSSGGISIFGSEATLNNLIISNTGTGIDYNGYTDGYSWGNGVDLDNFIIRNNGVGIITGGHQPYLYGNHGQISNNGRGVYVGWSIESGNLVELDDVIIEKNGSINVSGGGLYAVARCNLVGVIIRENTALNGGGIYYRAIDGGSEPKLNVSNSVIEDNIAIEKGGGIYVERPTNNFTIDNSIIKNNQAIDGGGLYIDFNSSSWNWPQQILRIKNVEISTNHATNFGGGIYLNILNNGAPKDISHLTVVNNTADNLGSGIYNTSVNPPYYNDEIAFKNSIIWNNPGDEITDLNGTLYLNYNDIEGAWPGTGNINEDPLFINTAFNNYGLMWVNYPQNDYTKSPCIDSGDPTSPHDPDGTVADMGAYPFSQTGQQMINLDVKVFLEGPFEDNQMNPYLNSQGLLPLHQPYCKSPWSHYGSESVASLPNNNIIDWVFVEIRKINDPEEPENYIPISRQAAFLMNDGTIRSINGSLLSFYTSETSGLYICIFHRNHLPVISSNPFTTETNPVTYDFSLSAEMAIGGICVQNEIAPGIWGMIAADGNNNNQVENRDKDEIFLIQDGNSGYNNADFNMDGQINILDLQKWELNAGKGNSVYYTNFPILCGYPYTDERDGQSYNTILIGNQCWMAENLNIGTQKSTAEGQDPTNGIIEKYCYNNQPTNCDTYGGLYLWDEMMQNSTDTINQGICPSGWRIPTDFDWKVLEGSVDSQYGVGNSEWNGTSFRGLDAGLNLKSLTGWFNSGNGTDLYGFNSMPSGEWRYSGSFLYIQQQSFYFTATQADASTAWMRSLFYNSNQSFRDNFNKTYGFSVRCIKE